MFEKHVDMFKNVSQSSTSGSQHTKRIRRKLPLSNALECTKDLLFDFRKGEN